MPNGIWSEGNLPEIPGNYNRFIGRAVEAATIGVHGILGLPVRANWGPIGEVASVNNKTALKNQFGSGLTAKKLGELAIDGAPKELVLCRVASELAAQGVLVLKSADESPKELLTVKTKYCTDREFALLITECIEDSAKLNLYLYEGNSLITPLEKITNSLASIESQIQKNLSKYLVCERKEGANDTDALATIEKTKLVGGNNGADGISVEDYLSALDKFADYGVDGFVLDGVSDRSIQNACIESLKEYRNAGQAIYGFFGGAGVVDEGNTASKNMDDMFMHNVVNGLKIDGIEYTPAECAVLVASLGLSGNIKDCLAYKKILPGRKVEVVPRLSMLQMKDCSDSGSILFFIENNIVRILDDKNTFTSYDDNFSEVYGNFRAIRFITTVNKDTTVSNSDLIGINPCNDDGKTAILCKIKSYFEELQKQNVIEEFEVKADVEANANAKKHQFFWYWNADYINVVKQLFGTGYLK